MTEYLEAWTKSKTRLVMPVKCALCQKPCETSEFCSFHAEIDERVNQSFKVWFEAYDGKLTLTQYLEKILTLSETGEEVKRVASHLLLKGKSFHAKDAADM